ncbi:hypothetical protein GCM10029976_041800 [Kribbella albertanoniae]|uniref:STAS domain-containing protein n=1 Tax=Kribbella albertanoniae TaxID=1266829 RepID=A0A4V2XSA8_9ACTN|nr:hypothetical protein [Kribbella albertanoniae]TDC32475.1 hypothetical protein E1261_08275 [Kribbella albertanoniae]
MTVLEHETYEPANDPGVRLERVGSQVRIIIDAQLSEAVSAAVRELLVDVCDRRTRRVVIALEAGLGPVDHEVLPHLLDVAERRCWSASCHLDVTASTPEVLELLATLGF